MDTVIEKQFKIAGQIQRTIENLKKLGQANITQGVVEAKLASLEGKWAAFQTDHEALENRASKADLDREYFKQDVFSRTEDFFILQKGILLDTLRSYSESRQVNPANPALAAPAEPLHRQALPKIDRPKFSGEFSEWTTFKDLFTSMIVNNRSLSPVERLQYFKMSVTKEPSSLLASIPTTADNFQVAWTALTDRYENARLLVLAQISSLFALPALSSESSADLKRLFNGTVNAVGALRSLGRPIEQCDDFTVYMTVQKLDKQSRREWESLVSSKKQPPNFADLKTFLENRICSVEALEGPSKLSQASGTPKASPLASSRQAKSSIRSHVASSSPAAQKCPLCQKGHYILFCEAFRAKSADDRKAFILSNNLCLNCLGPHFVRECRSQKTCQTCKKKHHTMLHDASSSIGKPTPAKSPSPAPQQTNPPEERPGTSTAGTVATHTVQFPRTPPHQRVLLATALVKVETSYGGTSLVRALLDQGSEASLVAESLVQRLRFSRSSASVLITGVGGSLATQANGLVSFFFSPRSSPEPKFKIDAFVMPRLTAYEPSGILDTSQWSHLNGLFLADADMSSTQPIEILLGADVYAGLILPGIRRGRANSPVAQNTRLGWILSGRISPHSAHTSTISSMQICLHTRLDDSLKASLERFWEQEELPSPKSQLSAEEQECENHFLSTHFRNDDGRYVVRLPTKKPITELGNSLAPASRMLHRMENRFSRDSSFHEAYSGFMTEYEDLRHMEVVPPSENPSAFSYYLPHHGVIRESSSTTRLRVVFNGSQKTDRGVSLNNFLHIGPKLLPDLIDILLRWRAHCVVFSVDMEKMYRQDLVHEDDRDLQRILWRKPSHSTPDSYRLRTVTYGLACAPFLAIRVIRQLAHDEKSRFPVGASSLLADVSVDDVLSGADDTSSALVKQQEIIELLKAGGFALRKWTSNSPTLLDHLPHDSRAPAPSIEWQPEASFHMLGLTWQSSTDSFLFSVNETRNVHPLTKRNVLSRIAQLFDPLGWLAPVTVAAKIFMQSLWLLKLDWDDPFPDPETQSWNSFYTDPPTISELRVPRWLGLSPNQLTCELHGFADASERAYAAVIYLRITSDHGTTVTLVAAKTKVAPIKQISLPRLQLCAAHLVTKLARHVSSTLHLSSTTRLWSDSKITLAWISGVPTRWTTFVANRVSDIQKTLPTAVWGHVESRHNPAVCASLGIPASTLKEHPLWWTGPQWLREPPSQWPKQLPLKTEALPETRASCQVVITELEEPMRLLTRYSNLKKILRITSWCLRFATATRAKIRTTLPLRPLELDDALQRLVISEQKRYFKDEIRAL